MQLSLLPIIRCHQSIECQAHEEPLTEAHLLKIQDIEKRTLDCFPKNEEPYIKAWKYNYPSFSYTLPELKEFLQTTLSEILQEPVECYLVGGAAHPNEDLPFNDIDIAIYLRNPDFGKIDLAIGQFIAKHVQKHHQFDPAKMPLSPTWILSKAYYKHRVIFKDRSGAIYGIREKSDHLGGVDIKILKKAHFHSCSPTDGAQVSLTRYMLRYSLGEDFAKTKEEFQKADQVARKLFYEISNPDKIEKLFLRLLFKWTHLHTFTTSTLVIAKVNFTETFKKNIEAFEHQFKNHYLTHYPTANGKICDFLNLLFFYQNEPQMCRYFANLWLRNNEEFQFPDEGSFAELIVSYPFLVPHLLSFIGCLTYAASLREESKESSASIKYRFSHSEHPSIFLTEKVGERERTYRISFGWSLRQLISLKNALPEALKNLNVKADCLNGLFRSFQLDPDFLVRLDREEVLVAAEPKAEGQLPGLKSDVSVIKRDVPTQLKAIIEYVKGSFKEPLSSEEIYCKAFEMGLIPEVLVFPILQQVIKSKKKGTLSIVFQQLQIQIEKKGNPRSIFDLLQSLINSKEEMDLDRVIIKTIVQIYKCHPSLFEMCCKDQKLGGELLTIIRRNSNEFEILNIVLEFSVENINQLVLEIFNEWLNGDIPEEHTVPFAIKLLEKEVALKPDVASFWIHKIALKTLYSIATKQVEAGDSAFKLKNQAIRLLTLLPENSRDEIRQIILKRLCVTLLKKIEHVSAVFPILTEALTQFLPSSHAASWKNLNAFDIVANRSEMGQRLVQLVDEFAPKLEIEKSYLKLQKIRVKNEKKAAIQSSEKLAKKLFGMINDSPSYEFQEVSRLYFKLVKLFLKEKSKTNNKWITDILNRLISYTDPNSLSMATHLYKNAYDHQLLSEEEVHSCGINLIRGYGALQELDSSFNPSNDVLSIVKRVMKDEKQSFDDLILLFNRVKATGRLGEVAVFDIAFSLFLKLMEHRSALFYFSDYLFDLLSHWQDDDKYFDSLIELIKSRLSIFNIPPRTFMMLFRTISLSNNSQKLETLWSCFQSDKESYTKLAYYELLKYFDSMNSETEIVNIQMGINLLNKYEEGMIKLAPEIEAAIDYTKVILYCASRQQDYIKRACEICLKQNFISQSKDYRFMKEPRSYMKLFETVLDSFLFIPLKTYSPDFAKTTLSFIKKLEEITTFNPEDIKGSVRKQPSMQCDLSSRIISVFAYFSLAPNIFPKMHVLLFDLLNHHIPFRLKLEGGEDLFDLLINISHGDTPVGRLVHTQMITTMYSQIQSRLSSRTLDILKKRMDAYLLDEHKKIKKYFIELEKVDKRVDETEFVKTIKFFSTNFNRAALLFELYELCNPSLGKEIIECIYTAIMKHISFTPASPIVLLKLIREAIEKQFYSHEKIGLFSISGIDKESLRKNRIDLNKTQLSLIKHSLSLEDEECFMQAEKFIPDALHLLNEMSAEEQDDLTLICMMTLSRKLILFLSGREKDFSLLDQICSIAETDLEKLEYILTIVSNLFFSAILSTHIASRLRIEDAGRENSLEYLRSIYPSPKLTKLIKKVADDFKEIQHAEECFLGMAKSLIRTCTLKDLVAIEQSVESSSDVSLKIIECCIKLAKRIHEINKDEKQLIVCGNLAESANLAFSKMMSSKDYKRFLVKFIIFAKKWELFPEKAESVIADKKGKKKGKKKK